MKKCVSLKNLFENGIPCLEFGGTIKFHKESEADYDLVNDIQEVILRDNEELDFGEWCCDETDGKFIVGTAESGREVYFSKEEYDLAVSEKQTIELGKEYYFAGYKWIPVKKNANKVVIQSLGVTAGSWPGYKMLKFGGKIHGLYTSDIDGQNISAYDDKMQELYDIIKEVEDTSASYGRGLYLISKEKASFTKFGESALKEAANCARSFGASSNYAWLGTVCDRFSVWVINSNGYVYGSFSQYDDYVVAPAFNLDLSKVEVCGDEIIIKDDKPQPQTYGIMLIEKPEVEGLTKSEVMQMYDQMDADEAYPLEISGCETSAMGFITKDAAKILDYDYEESGLKDFVATILNDMNNESIDGIYKFRGIKIRLFR